MIKLFDNEMNEIKLDIESYLSNLFPLDNFSPFGLIMNEEHFSTSEHAFQYLKFINTNLEIANRVKNTLSPNEAKSIAHQNKNFKQQDWSDIKYVKMEEVLRLKVNQNPIVKKALINTQNYIIAECCIDEDTEWGIDNNNQGENNLGKIWMKIREEIKK